VKEGATVGYIKETVRNNRRNTQKLAQREDTYLTTLGVLKDGVSGKEALFQGDRIARREENNQCGFHGRGDTMKANDKIHDEDRHLEEYREHEETKKFLFGWTKTNPMVSVSDTNEIDEILRGLSRGLLKENLQGSVVDKIMGEVITRAYQDELIAYVLTSPERTLQSTQRLQRIRQSADLHLVRMLRAFMEMKRPPVSVIVKKTSQVNVGDKQINVSQEKD